MSDRKDFLLEIGTEEIPARFLPPALKQMRALAAEAMVSKTLDYQQIDIYATPRRLTLIVKGLVTRQLDSKTEIKGPALKSAYDADGAPTKALLGFCKGHGLEPDSLRQKEISGNIYLFADKEIAGQPTVSVLPELVNNFLSKIHFPKPMRWGYQEMRFARPLRWLVVLFGNEVVEMEIADVKADRISRGHRTLGSQQIIIDNADSYLQKLAENFVICDQQQRRQIIWQQINDVAASVGGRVEDDQELLSEVVFLVEYPTALVGSFDKKYLEIPQELVITPMREHQRYFPVYDQSGKLLPLFITVRNGDDRFLKTVTAGNEKVLRARLSDAEFFWHEDLAADLEANVEKLSSVVFHEKIGTLRQKVTRIGKLASLIATKLDYDKEDSLRTQRAALLAKADLVSNVVYEFPELQGIIGEYYALAADEDKFVAQAIREHYMPRFAGDQLPQSRPGIAVSLADKLDSLCCFFAIGMQPTGSQDPYALRRAAAGCTQIIIKNRLYISLQEIFEFAYQLLQQDVPSIGIEECSGNLLEFFRQRVENFLDEEQVAYDTINAVTAKFGDNILDVLCRVEALRAYRLQPGFAPLMAGFTRAANSFTFRKKRPTIC